MHRANRWTDAALLLLPIAVGVYFAAATQGYADGPIYRATILELHETGV